MSKMKYLLLLLCLTLAVVAATPVLALDVDFQTWNLNANPGFAVTGDFEYGVPAGLGGDLSGNGEDPASGNTGTNIYGTNLDEGNYTPGTSSTLTSTAVVCTNKFGIRLSFYRWLCVEDGGSDQATVAVSNDGATYVTLWTNPITGPTWDDSVGWTLKEYDISAVADNQSTVYIQWSLTSNATVEYGGWNVDDIVLTEVADDLTSYVWDMTTDPFTLGFTSTGTNWEWGLPLAGGGQLITDPLASRTGADPATDADGATTDEIVGFVQRDGGDPDTVGNYPTGMTGEEYFTTPAMDFTGMRDIKFTYQRYLGIEDGTFDKGGTQIHSDTSMNGLDVLRDDFEAAAFGAAWTFGGNPATGPTLYTGTPKNGTQAVRLQGTQTMTATISTREMYNLEVTFAMERSSFESGDTISVQYSTDSGSTWTTFAGATLGGPFVGPPSTLQAKGPYSLPAAAENIADLMIRVVMATDSLTDDFGYFDDLVVTGDQWPYLWENPVDPDGTFDAAWTEVQFDLSAYADVTDVEIRWLMGPTDTFVNTNYGGWSIDNIVVTRGTQGWRAGAVTVPAAMIWGEAGAVSVNAANTGTATWDSGFSMINVEEPTNPISRWAMDEIAVAAGTTVPAGSSYDFADSLTAPPLSTVIYEVDPDLGEVDDTQPASAELSVISSNWRMDGPTGWVPIQAGGDIALSDPGVVISRFPDIQPGTDGGWARFEIEQLAGRVEFIVKGFEDGTYRPLVTLDRGAIAVYIFRAAALTPTGYQGIFRDVPEDYWAAIEIETCKDNGIVAGFPPDFANYRPADVLDRQQMAKFIALGAQLPSGGADPPFTDWDTISPVLQPYVRNCYNSGVVKGYEDGTYRPLVEITRDQLAVYIWRAFMMPSGASVILGGPAVTDAGDPMTTTWFGWPSVSEQDEGDTNYAYVVFDAIQFDPTLATSDGATADWDVTLELRPVQIPTYTAFSFAYQFTPSDLEAMDDDASTDPDGGIPYVPLSMDLTTAPDGDFILVVTAEGDEARVQPGYKIFGTVYDLMTEETPTDPAPADADWTFDATEGPPVVSPNGVDSVTGLHVYSLEFTGNQFMRSKTTGAISTVGLSNIRVSFDLGGINLGASDIATVEWTYDLGGHWIALDSISSTTTDGLVNWHDGLVFDLPVIAANNGNFQLRVSFSSTTVGAAAYLDNLIVKATDGEWP